VATPIGVGGLGFEHGSDREPRGKINQRNCQIGRGEKRQLVVDTKKARGSQRSNFPWG